MSENKKYLSVIIPCYNSAEYMHVSIESALVGGEDVEILIVDDGSTKDNTYEIAKQYEEKYPTIIRAITQENKGHGGAVNTGIANATGEYIKVLDSDDWLDEYSLLYILNKLKGFSEGEKPDLYLANYVYEKEGKSHKKRMHYENVFPTDKLFTWNDIGSFLLDQYILMHSVMYKRQLLLDCNLKLPEHMFYVDNVFVFEPLMSAEKLYFSDVNLYRYFIGREDQSVNESVMISRIDQQLHINKRMIKFYSDVKDFKYKKRKKYMEKYLLDILMVSSILLLVSGTEENLKKKDELWEYLKECDPKLYVKIRNGILGRLFNSKKTIVKKFLVFGYKGLNKYMGFN